MAAPYSEDLRSRVLGAYARGMQTKEISEALDVGPPSSGSRRARTR